VDLPNQKEREAIWSIHIAKRKRNPETFQIQWMAEQSDGYSGRQIEQAWIAAMTLAFDDNGREPVDLDCVHVLSKMVPTSVTMKDQIEARRKRLAGCARPASTPPPTTKMTTTRKLA
jgi:SpoVK/Ycf46/Vps4 family AAA+-type ATPase